MTSVAISIIERGLDHAAEQIVQLTTLDRHELMDTVGRLIQGQTRQRIAVEKSGPDGTPWKANRAGSGILYSSGRLHDSINNHTGLDDLTIGSPLIYAAIHHFGGVIKPKNGKTLAFMAGNSQIFAKSVTMPARPYLGLSTDNRDEIESVVSDFISEVLQ